MAMAMAMSMAMAMARSMATAMVNQRLASGKFRRASGGLWMTMGFS